MTVRHVAQSCGLPVLLSEYGLCSSEHGLIRPTAHTLILSACNSALIRMGLRRPASVACDIASSTVLRCLTSQLSTAGALLLSAAVTDLQGRQAFQPRAGSSIRCAATQTSCHVSLADCATTC